MSHPTVQQGLGCTLSPLSTSEQRPDDIVIAIMGKVGHGKTSFLNLLANPDKETVLNQTAPNIVPSKSFGIHRLRGWQGDRLVFLDTPGFESAANLDGIIANMKKEMQKQCQIQDSGGYLVLTIYCLKFLGYLAKSLGTDVEVVDPDDMRPSRDFGVYRLHGRYNDKIVFLDAPGFDTDDDTRNLRDIIAEAKQLINKYPNKKLAGIIYLYAFNEQPNSTPVEGQLLPEFPLYGDFSSMVDLCYAPECVQFVTWAWKTHPDNRQLTNIMDNFSRARKRVTDNATYSTLWDGPQQHDTAWKIMSSIADRPQVSTQPFPAVLDSAEYLAGLQKPKANRPAAPSAGSRLGSGFKRLFCCGPDIEPTLASSYPTDDRAVQRAQTPRSQYLHASAAHSQATSLTTTVQ